MRIHDKAWDGLKILIYGNTPLLPMKIEQSIVNARPELEIQVESFENYDQAYKYCKTNNDIGFIILSDTCKDGPFLSVFRELAKQYKKGQFPAFGLVYFEGQGNILNSKLVGKTSQLIDYIDVNGLLESKSCPFLLDQVWTGFTDAFQELVLPAPLQKSLLSIAGKQISEPSLVLASRFVQNLSSEMNVTWLESVALNWFFIINAVKNSCPESLEPHPFVEHFLEATNGTKISTDEEIVKFLSDNNSAGKKIASLTTYLVDRWENNKLEESLDFISKSSKVTSPKLVKHISRNKDRLLAATKDLIGLLKNG